jgi:chromate transporter
VPFLGATVEVPVPATLDPAALLLAAAAAFAIFRFQASVILVLFACAAAGVVYRLAIG